MTIITVLQINFRTLSKHSVSPSEILCQINEVMDIYKRRINLPEKQARCCPVEDLVKVSLYNEYKPGASMETASPALPLEVMRSRL